MASSFVPPPTPDFDHYAWTELVSADTTGDWVRCVWADGAEHRFYGLWLWENTVGRGTDPTTREMTIDPGDLPTPEVIESVAVDGDGALIVNWSRQLEGLGPPAPDGAHLDAAAQGDASANGDASDDSIADPAVHPIGDPAHDRLHPGWLRSVGDGNQLPLQTLPTPAAWQLAAWAARTGGAGADGQTPPPSVDGRDVLVDDGVLTEWLQLAVTYGVARLTNVPTDLDFLDQLGERIGPIRATNFGRLFSVRSVVEPTAEQNSVANTGLKLGQHTDLPSRETPPGFQLLHCIENTVPGGWATFTDGAALTDRLRSEHPDAFEALTTLRWIFANRSPDADHRWSGPMIELGTDGRPLTLRCFYPVRAVPDMEDADIPRAYEAMRRLSLMSRQPGHTIRFPYSPGDLVIFDNRRCLHGRDAFDPGGGERHLRGCYYDHDDVYSCLRVLLRARRRSSPTLSNQTPPNRPHTKPHTKPHTSRTL